MDQFSVPTEHFAEPPPAPPSFALPNLHAGNGAHPPFNGFDDPMPPMGEHGMPPSPPGHEAPFEPNPLLAALAQEPLPEPPLAPQKPLFAPMAPRATAPQHRPNGAGNGAENGAKPAVRRTMPDFSGLPPAMAESLAKLAGVPWPPRSEGDEHELEDQGAGPLPGAPRREG
jgi:hypothetical protein